MTRNLLTLLAFMLTGTFALAQTSLGGKVTEEETGEPVIFGNVALYKGGVLVTGVETDFDGNYNIPNIDPGTYDVEATYVGFNPTRITDVVVLASKANKLDIQLGTGGVTLDEVIVKGYRVPLIEQDNTTQGGIITGEQINTLPTKNINGLAAMTAGASSADEGDAVGLRGSRSDATDYYVDGIRVRAANLPPQTEIDQLQVITGGVEARYGDVTGGVISITTKGPSSQYSGYLEVETSEPFDSYGYNQLTGSLSGPILKREDGASILGFRLGGQYTRRTDDDPPALPMFRVSDAKLAELEANPLLPLAGGIAPAAEFVTNEDIDVLDFRPNEERENINLTGKIDARLSDAIDVTLSGSYIDDTNRFTPESNTIRGIDRPWDVFNTHNNPYDYNTRYRGNFRFRHRLGGNNVGSEEDRTASVIQNASYILQFGYERNLNQREDSQHEDNFFNYGHIGNFNYTWTPVVDIVDSSFVGAQAFPNPANPQELIYLGHADYSRRLTSFDFSNSSNPVLANYNNVLGADIDFAALAEGDVPVINGQFNGPFASAWSTHTNVGQVYDFTRQEDNDYYTLSVSSNFDLVPGGDSKKGRHSIEFGVWYEQRFLRRHELEPFQLWTVARNLANSHLTSVDSLASVGTFPIESADDLSGNLQGFAGQLIGEEFDQYAPQSIAPTTFAERVRAAQGVPINEFINVDGLNPDELSLAMFSPLELLSFAGLNMDYQGYDYLGNKLANDVSFDDFFTATDAEGNRTFPVAAFQPIYWAGYVQDKFTFKDIIFRLGVRMDYYDANTRVLKDPYSLYDIMTVDDFYADFGGELGAEPPATIGGDYKVYVDGDSEGSTNVTAYRDGENWYYPDGAQANDGNEIFGQNGIVTPRYYADRVNNIRSNEFDPDNSFTDYEPQINWMPRLAFSFPISDEANFYANYDILVQRPNALQTRATPIDYFFINERSGSSLYRNPALRPQRTATYEVGFKQKLSESSALNVSAYYRELRDMIQRRTYFNVASPINRYDTYDNQDFGTVKAFTFQYDMRRTSNLQINATYTLQFADGTGSNANSQADFTSQGNLRTLFPLDFDERHRFVLMADYRYASGKQYDGPVVAGRDIFANAGVNLQATAVSGRPYTATNLPTRFDGSGTRGSLNGARKPWNYWLNLRVDKDFNLSKPDATRPLNLNIYFRVQNLLDARNVIDVYTASGSPEDDGFLTSANGLDAIEDTAAQEGRNLDAFLDAYNWEMINPGFYSIPRRMYIGAIFDF